MLLNLFRALKTPPHTNSKYFCPQTRVSRCKGVNPKSSENHSCHSFLFFSMFVIVCQVRGFGHRVAFSVCFWSTSVFWAGVELLKPASFWGGK